MKTDTNGNMVSKGEGTNFWRYGFDYENRLVNASTRKQTVRYRYDALGRRVQCYTVGVKENTKFIYDGQDVVADDNFGVLTKYQNGLGIDNKLKVSINGTSKYFLADHLGSTNALTDSSGAIVEQTAYDSFGNATNTLSMRYQYTGREFDNFTGLHYYRARFYDANLGRFISEDPIGFRGGDINLFSYVGNNPLKFTDPSGNSRCNPYVAALLGGIAGGAGGALAGSYVGGLVGGLAGAGGGTLVAPGVGTLGGGVGGAATGAAVGAVVGGVAGAGTGGYLAYQYCNQDAAPTCDAKPKPIPMSTPRNDPLPTPTPSSEKFRCTRIDTKYPNPNEGAVCIYECRSMTGRVWITNFPASKFGSSGCPQSFGSI